ncbi:THUMP domain-containing protein 3 [Haplosporangium sp. Z 767]|nr:THUMP domain-containing protein 3 [Haplosporangium sp. Z 11]KAF9194183.1 THUMP domain-containing protein 3 [Haplosporangium sp. Z 767]
MGFSMDRQDSHLPFVELFLSVLSGLEDVAAAKLPRLLVDVATNISYRIGSGYLTISIQCDYPRPSTLSDSDSKDRRTSIAAALVDLVQHPPLPIFAAYVSIGDIIIPHTLFEEPKALLAYAMNGFKPPQAGPVAQNADDMDACIYKDNSTTDLGLRWQDALSVLRLVSPAIEERLSRANQKSQGSGASDNNSICFRASFDRRDVQHKGVRSQDLAAALGGLTGDVFPSWKVNLKEFDIEVIGRWIQENLNEIEFKSPRDQEAIHKRARLDSSALGDGQSSQEGLRMQVGLALPLKLSTCPYRFRPMDGRTSLKIEIAYTLLAFASPKPGDVVVDMCSGVGTIPIVGAAHYPESLFVGFEIVPYNVEKAAQNAREMMERVDKERSLSRPSHSRPSLFLGDAKAVCWRSGSVDLIISDLPWGQRENSHLYNCKLYPRLVKEMIRLLKVNGRAVVVTGERKLFQRQLDAPFSRPYLRVVRKREIAIGFKVMVFELLRVCKVE